MVQRVAGHPKPRPRFIEPMEGKRVPKLPEGDAWVYEPKQDGYRIIAMIDGSSPQLFSMSGLNYTAKYPNVGEAFKWLKLKEAVFDGEVVALDESGKPNFQELQNARLTKVPIRVPSFSICSTRKARTCWIFLFRNGGRLRHAEFPKAHRMIPQRVNSHFEN